MPFLAWLFLVHEQVLKFCRAVLANRLETVARLPMSEGDRLAKRSSVEHLTVLRLA